MKSEQNQVHLPRIKAMRQELRWMANDAAPAATPEPAGEEIVKLWIYTKWEVAIKILNLDLLEMKYLFSANKVIVVNIPNKKVKKNSLVYNAKLSCFYMFRYLQVYLK